MEFNLLSHLTATKKCAIRVSGIVLPSLLVSNDIVFVGTNMQVAMYIRYNFHILCIKLSLNQFAQNRMAFWGAQAQNGDS